MIKGWRLNPSWLHLYEARKTQRIQRESMIAQTKASLRSVEIQEEQHKKALEFDAAQRAHMEECHSEKVAAGEIPARGQKAN